MAATNQDFTELLINRTEQILSLYEQIQQIAAATVAEYNALGANTQAATGPLGPDATWGDLGLHFTRNDAILAVGSLGTAVPAMLAAGDKTNLYKVKR